MFLTISILGIYHLDSQLNDLEGYCFYKSLVVHRYSTKPAISRQRVGSIPARTTSFSRVSLKHYLVHRYLTAFVPDALVDAIPPRLASAPGS